MAMRYQSSAKKSNRKFEVVGARQLAVHLPLPLVELWEELQPQVEHLAGLAGLQIIRGVIEEEVTRRVGPRYQPDPALSCVRWGQQPGYVVFAGQKVEVKRPRVRMRKGQEVSLDSYARPGAPGSSFEPGSWLRTGEAWGRDVFFHFAQRRAAIA